MDEEFTEEIDHQENENGDNVNDFINESELSIKDNENIIEKPFENDNENNINKDDTIDDKDNITVLKEDIEYDNSGLSTKNNEDAIDKSIDVASENNVNEDEIIEDNITASKENVEDEMTSSEFGNQMNIDNPVDSDVLQSADMFESNKNLEVTEENQFVNNVDHISEDKIENTENKVEDVFNDGSQLINNSGSYDLANQDNVENVMNSNTMVTDPNKQALNSESENIKNVEFDRLPQASETKSSGSTLTPVFSFGFNRHVPIINLSTDKRCFIFYSCSHLGIIYDYFHNEQLILQGHCNSINCTTASNDKRWLGTGDQGENSVVIIWDCNTGLPVRTMFEPHPNGVIAINLTSDARYLATLSAENTQTFAIWDWTNGEDIPLCSASLSRNYGVQSCISFNTDDFYHVATNSETQVLFYQWDKIGNIKYFAPKLTDQDFNKPIGKFCNTVFLPKTTRAISATSQGLLVVWEGNVSLVKVPNESTPNKKAVKLVPVQDKAITFLTLTGDYIVIGDVGGDVKFLDHNYMLMFWYQDWNFGPITSISSCMNSNLEKRKTLLEKSAYPGDTTIQNNKFAIHDFIIGTATTIFATITVEGSKVKIIFRDHDQSVFSADTHPTLPLVATGSYSGLLKLWNYEKRESIKTRLFNKVPIRSLCFDNHGVHLAIGFSNGELRILDTHALKDTTSKPFHFSKVHITHIRFSEKSEFLATVDGNFTTTLYRPRHNPSEEAWVYIARYRAHYKRVLDLLFGRYFDTGTCRLFTLGEDRRLVEYDLYNATEDNLKILQETRIEQSAIPLSLCWYPDFKGEGFLMTANDQYKLKLYNHQTKMCRFTYLGPTFGSPVKILKPLPVDPNVSVTKKESMRRYIAYSNHNKIGIIRTPVNGDPYNYITMIAHPKGTTSLSCSFDGKYLISVGEDFIVTLWQINLEVLENQAKIHANEMSAYYELIEGGEFGQFIHDLKDYFYYSMLRTDGIDNLQKRKVDIVINISEVPYIMRAIGFYPSEEDIANMLNEIKFKNFIETGELTTQIDLNTFIKLYINHRPAFGIPFEKIEETFRILEKSEHGELSITKFLDLLMNKGETILEDDLAEYLATLLGFNEEGGSLEMEEFHPDKVMKAVNEALPKVVTAKTFIKDIINIKVVSKESSESKEAKTTKVSKKTANFTQT